MANDCDEKIMKGSVLFDIRDDDSLTPQATPANDPSIVRLDDSDASSNEVSENDHSCVVCGKIFPSLDEVLLHLKEHTEQNCSKELNQQYTCDKNKHINHMNTHMSVKYTECQCGNIVKQGTKHDCTANIKLDFVKPFKCNQCESRFISKSGMKNHMKSHTGEGQYTCNTCNKRFPTASTLEIHIRIHTGEKPYKCSQCDKGFTVMCHASLEPIRRSGCCVIAPHALCCSTPAAASA